MFNKIKQDYNMLKLSGRNIWIFELIYKLAATVVVYPLFIGMLNLILKVTGIRYLTNEYIAKLLTNPVAILLILVVIIVFAVYCLFEMSFLSACHELKRKNVDKSFYELVYTAFFRMKLITSVKNLYMIIFCVVWCMCINIAVVMNVLYSQTIVNLLKTGLIYGKWYIQFLVAVTALILLVIAVMGIFTFNICFLERIDFKESYKKSAKIVRKHPGAVLFSVIAYNLGIFAVICICYVIIAAVFFAGIKILDMAYIGSTAYLTVLKFIRRGSKIVLAYFAIPCSYTGISRLYYKYGDVKNIDYPVLYIKERYRKIHRIAYAGVLVISIGLSVMYTVLAFDDNPFDKIAIFHDTTVTAHRGGALTAPENTIAAFKNSIENHVDYIELDVRKTKDGALVIMHDSNVYRTTGVDKKVSDMTLAEIKELDAGSFFSKEYAGEKVPTLDEVLKLTKGKIKLNIEIKVDSADEDIAKAVVDVIEKYDAVNECVITSFDRVVLRNVKLCNKDIQVGYILSVAYGNFYDMEDVDFFSMNASFLSKRLIDAIHNSGKQVCAWTVNSETSIRNLTNKGVDNIITDNPIVAKDTILSRDTSENVLTMFRYVFNS